MNISTIYFIQILDLIYTNFIYIFLAFVIGVLIDQFYGKFDTLKYDKMNLIVIFLDIAMHIILITIILFVVRIAVLYIDSPFSFIPNYDRNKSGQIQSASIFTPILFVFQKNLGEKMKYFLVRLDKKYNFISNYE